MIALQILVLIAVPFFLLWLQSKLKWFKAIVMSYVFGIVVGNLFPSIFDLSIVQEITGISIILAIPLMLFPTSIPALLKQPKTLLISYGLAVLSTSLSVLFGYWIFKGSLEDIELISGMLGGVYTGGTVNLNAIAYAFQVDNELVILMNGFDWSLSGVYLLLIFTILPKVLGWVLPEKLKYQVAQSENLEHGFDALKFKEKFYSISKGLSISVLLLGVMAGISILWNGRMNELVIIFGVTGLALALSNIKSVRNLKGSMVTADYLMLLFGLTLGLQANVLELFADQSELFSYFLVTFSVMLVIHLILAKLFRIDVQTFLISSSAAVFGPPFIGPIAESLNNRSLIPSGIIIALVGNAIGTYLGVLIVKILLGL